MAASGPVGHPLRAIFEKAPDGGWFADVPEMPGCSVKGQTIAEARARLQEAVSAYVPDGDRVIFEEEISWNTPP